jgi:hypothetical protein
MHLHDGLVGFCWVVYQWMAFIDEFFTFIAWANWNPEVVGVKCLRADVGESIHGMVLDMIV